jgi:YbbR domain-containing protein
VSWTLITDNWRLKLLSLGLAVLMLGAVAFSQNPPTTGSQSIPLSYSVPGGLILINPPTKATVTYSGLADVIKRVNPDNLTAFVDASQARPGAAVRLNVTASTTLGSAVSVQNPAPIVVTVDTRAVKEIAVQVNARAAAGWTLTKAVASCPGSTTANPCKVNFDGPASWETNLTATATLPGLVSVGSQDSPNQPIQLSNSNGPLDLSAVRTVAPAVLDVTSVNIHVEAAPGASSSTVPLVDSAPSHPPPAGYRVTGITITPITVVISGDPALLGRISRITLPPVDLSRATSDSTFTVAIPYPDGTTGPVGNATVKYSISPNPNVSPSPSPS